jgi:hypothetical protein
LTIAQNVSSIRGFHGGLSEGIKTSKILSRRLLKEAKKYSLLGRPKVTASNSGRKWKRASPKK